MQKTCSGPDIAKSSFHLVTAQMYKFVPELLLTRQSTVREIGDNGKAELVASVNSHNSGQEY